MLTLAVNVLVVNGLAVNRPSPSIEYQKMFSALEIVSKSDFCTLFRVISLLSVLL